MNYGTVGSLFSGIGGIEIAFEQQGFRTVWFIEYEPYAQAVLRKRFSDAIIYGDIKAVDFTKVPRVDILTGGFPCQDISNAGKRAGITGSRSSLWKYYCEAIRILRPRIAVIENVSALARRGLNVVLADLAKIGYDAEWYNISASTVGALHRRERIFIMAYPHFNGSGTHRGSVKREAEEVWGEKESNLPVQCSEDVANTKSNNKTSLCREAITKHVKWDPRLEPECDGVSQGRYWSVEPELGRVAHGIPNRVDRIRCLGNAVVPQCAEVFAEAIKMILFKSPSQNQEKE